MEQCEKTGCINGGCFPTCKSSVNGVNSEASRSTSLINYWIEWDCRSECRYQCMIRRESDREEEGKPPVKYHGKWPFKRVLSLQEPSSVAFSIANLAIHVQGLSSFLVLVYYKLPRRPQGNKGPYYEYYNVWIMFGLASINCWLWSAAFHSRDLEITEKLDYSSAAALLGLMLIISIIRTFNLRVEAARVMVAAPIIAFVSTHILYLNFYNFDYGLNMKVCLTMAVIQLLLWTFWAGYSSHPARFKLWFLALASSMGMLLEILDFPPVWGLFDAHSLWHGVTVPLTLLWWSFIKDDALFRTEQLLYRSKEMQGSKKVQ